MPKEIQTKIAWANFTITLAALAASSARQSTMVSNSTRRPSAKVFTGLTSGAVAPSAGRIYEIFLLFGDDSGNRTDNAGASDAAITIENAQLLGALTVTATVNKKFSDEFDTSPLGKLGSEFGIAVRNGTDAAMNGTEGNHIKRYGLYLPEIQ